MNKVAIGGANSESHIISRMYDATVACEPNALLNGLKKLLDLYRVETKPGHISIRIVSDFVKMFEKSSPRKKGHLDRPGGPFEGL